MHTFKFVQNSNVALGCEVLLDGQPLKCDGFKLIASPGEVTIFEPRILVKTVEIDVSALKLKEEIEEK